MPRCTQDAFPFALQVLGEAAYGLGSCISTSAARRTVSMLPRTSTPTEAEHPVFNGYSIPSCISGRGEPADDEARRRPTLGGLPPRHAASRSHFLSLATNVTSCQTPNRPEHNRHMHFLPRHVLQFLVTHRPEHALWTCRCHPWNTAAPRVAAPRLVVIAISLPADLLAEWRQRSVAVDFGLTGAGREKYSSHSLSSNT